MSFSLKQVKTGEDAETVARLARKIWHQHYDGIIGAGQVDYMLSAFQSAEAVRRAVENGTQYRIALEDGHPVGYCAFEDQREKVFLSKIYLTAAARGKGYARRMLEEVKQAVPSPLPVYLTVNKRNDSSVAAYKAMGFRVVDSVVTDIGGGFVMDDYIMQLDR